MCKGPEARESMPLATEGVRVWEREEEEKGTEWEEETTSIYWLLWPRLSTKHFTFMDAFTHRNKPMRWTLLLFPFYLGANCGTDWLSHWTQDHTASLVSVAGRCNHKFKRYQLWS